MAVEGLVAERVSVSYGGVQAAQDVSFALEPGTLTSFVGPNGSGKSTALAALTRLVKPSSDKRYNNSRGPRAVRPAALPLPSRPTLMRPTSAGRWRAARRR